MNNKELLNTLWERVMFEVANKTIEKESDQTLRRKFKETCKTPPFSWQPVPNVAEFKITRLSPIDEPLEEHVGATRRLRKPEISYTPYRNKQMNRYVKYQFNRLWENIDNPRRFWTIAECLLHQSTSYWILIYQKVYPHWYKSQTYDEVNRTIQKFVKIDLRNYKYRIVEIPKTNGSGTRSLGIPDAEWRLYLHGLNNILLLWLSPYISEDQHGYYPNRGTNTAIKVLQEEVIESTNIYEFDLKKFFDSVNLDYLRSILLSADVPEALVELMIEWSRTPPRKGENPQQWESSVEEAQLHKYHETREWGFPKE